MLAAWGEGGAGEGGTGFCCCKMVALPKHWGLGEGGVPAPRALGRGKVVVVVVVVLVTVGVLVTVVVVMVMVVRQG